MVYCLVFPFFNEPRKLQTRIYASNKCQYQQIHVIIIVSLVWYTSIKRVSKYVTPSTAYMQCREVPDTPLPQHTVPVRRVSWSQYLLHMIISQLLLSESSCTVNITCCFCLFLNFLFILLTLLFWLVFCLLLHISLPIHILHW